MSGGKSISIKLDAKGARSTLRTATLRAGKPRILMTWATGDVAKAFRENFQNLDKSRSRYGHAFYVKEGANKTTSKVSTDGTSGEVTVASYLMAHKYFGGTVRPKRKFLAIPVSGWAKSQKRNPGDIPGLDVFVMGNGRAYLARTGADGRRKEGADWLLVRSVTHKPHPEVIPASSVLSAAIVGACAKYARFFGGAK